MEVVHQEGVFLEAGGGAGVGPTITPLLGDVADALPLVDLVALPINTNTAMNVPQLETNFQALGTGHLEQVISSARARDPCGPLETLALAGQGHACATGRWWYPPACGASGCLLPLAASQSLTIPMILPTVPSKSSPQARLAVRS